MVKIPTLWKPSDSGTATSVNDGVIRVTEIVDTRITETGDTRVLEPNVITTKIPVIWVES